MKIKLTLIPMLVFLLVFPAWGEAQKGTLTKEEAIKLLSATDMVKKKIGDLFSWTVGYDISKVNKVGLTPIVNYVKAIPYRVPPDGRTILGLYASINDPDGLANIAGVRADLSPIGRIPNTALVDNGMFGDSKAGDGIFTLQTTVSQKTPMGGKDIPVSVANKKGWLALAKASVVIDINPIIIEARTEPVIVPADGRSEAKFLIKIDNPGRGADVRQVLVDLSRFGLSSLPAQISGAAGEQVWVVPFILPATVSSGDYSLTVSAQNLAGGKTTGKVDIKVGK